jgi:inhibitor of the pro-sigma K processing machinery
LVLAGELTVLSLPWWALAILLIALAVLVIKFVKKILVNTALGLIALFVINFFGAAYGVKIPINLVTVIASALLGLAGVGALIILALLGIKV